VKNLARLALFFSITFGVVFITAAAARYITGQIEGARMIPALAGKPLAALFSALEWALPAAVYISVLLGLSYASRGGIPAPQTMVCLFVLGGLFSLGLSLGVLRADASGAVPAAAVRSTLGEPGLILSQGETVIVLLEDPREERGSRVVSLPGRPLIYQEVPVGADNTIITLPLIPFKTQNNYFIFNLLLDFSLTAKQFETRLNQGLISFIVYVLSLILLLVSLRFIMDLSIWPLANLFLGALAFRGILALESFINSEEIFTLIRAFLGQRIPEFLIIPLIFSGLSLLIILYSVLTSLARDRRRWDE
jgi:hypothetical protein